MSINSLPGRMKSRERSICGDYGSWLINPDLPKMF